MDSIFASATFVAIPMMFGFFSMIGGGILERHPKLRVGFFEAGADWLPYLAPRMERYWEVYSSKSWPGTPKRNPAEWFANGNIYFACEGDERYLPDVAELLGEDHLMTSADLPTKKPSKIPSPKSKNDPTSPTPSNAKSSKKTRRGSSGSRSQTRSSAPPARNPACRQN